MNIVSEVFEVWLLCQRKWMYLESIFLESDDIRLQLPEEAKKFDKIHKAFVTIMTATIANKNAMNACCQNDGARLQEFKDLIANFDKIQKSLTDYLDTKRSAFPRFYLISDDELLSILGTSDILAIQPHMIKLFDNCKELHFGRAALASAACSPLSSLAVNCRIGCGARVGILVAVAVRMPGLLEPAAPSRPFGLAEGWPSARRPAR